MIEEGRQAKFFEDLNTSVNETLAKRVHSNLASSTKLPSAVIDLVDSFDDNNDDDSSSDAVGGAVLSASINGRVASSTKLPRSAVIDLVDSSDDNNDDDSSSDAVGGAVLSASINGRVAFPFLKRSSLSDTTTIGAIQSSSDDESNGPDSEENKRYGAIFRGWNMPPPSSSGTMPSTLSANASLRIAPAASSSLPSLSSSSSRPSLPSSSLLSSSFPSSNCIDRVVDSPAIVTTAAVKKRKKPSLNKQSNATRPVVALGEDLLSLMGKKDMANLFLPKDVVAKTIVHSNIGAEAAAFDSKVLALTTSIQRKEWGNVRQFLTDEPLLNTRTFVVRTASSSSKTKNKGNKAYSTAMIQAMIAGNDETVLHCLGLPNGSQAAAMMTNKEQRRAMHCFVSSGPSIATAFKIIEPLYRAFPGAATAPAGRRGLTPVHISFMTQQRVTSGLLLIGLCPEAATISDSDGNTPLHHYCTLSSAVQTTQLKKIILAYPNAVDMKNVHGDTPLDLMKRGESNVASINILTAATSAPSYDDVAKVIADVEAKQPSKSKMTKVECKVDGCTMWKLPGLDGMCALHYRENNGGSLPPKFLCTVKDCTARRQKQGLCCAHYKEKTGELIRNRKKVQNNGTSKGKAGKRKDNKFDQPKGKKTKKTG